MHKRRRRSPSPPTKYRLATETDFSFSYLPNFLLNKITLNNNAKNTHPVLGPLPTMNGTTIPTIPQNTDTTTIGIASAPIFVNVCQLTESCGEITKRSGV